MKKVYDNILFSTWIIENNANPEFSCNPFWALPKKTYRYAHQIVCCRRFGSKGRKLKKAFRRLIKKLNIEQRQHIVNMIEERY